MSKFKGSKALAYLLVLAMVVCYMPMVPRLSDATGGQVYAEGGGSSAGSRYDGEKAVQMDGTTFAYDNKVYNETPEFGEVDSKSETPDWIQAKQTTSDAFTAELEQTVVMPDRVNTVNLRITDFPAGSENSYNRIAGIITNQSNEVLYYGQLYDDSDVSVLTEGAGLTLPGLTAGKYTLYLFAEADKTATTTVYKYASEEVKNNYSEYDAYVYVEGEGGGNHVLVTKAAIEDEEEQPVKLHEIIGTRVDGTPVQYYIWEPESTEEEQNPETDEFILATTTEAGDEYNIGRNISAMAEIGLVASSNQYTYTYTGNFADDEEGTITEVVTQSAFDGIETNLLSNPFQHEKNGYEIDGWSTTEGGSADYTSEETIEYPNGDLELYPVWKPATYTITYELNGAPAGVTAPGEAYSKYTYSEDDIALDLSGAVPQGTYPHHSFLYWADAEGTSLTAIAAGTYGDQVLTAMWEAEKYTVHFDAHEGTGTMPDQVISYGEAATLNANAFSNGSLQFQGWSTEPTHSADNPEYKDGAFAFADETLGASAPEGSLNICGKATDKVVTLYALWAAKAPASTGFTTTAALPSSGRLTDNAVYTASTQTIGGNNRLEVPANSTVVIYVPSGVTLTVRGNDGNNGNSGISGNHNGSRSTGTSGGSGGEPGIILPSTSTLIFAGGGSVNISGGNGGDGGTGGSGESASHSGDNACSGGGGSGAGGGGGGGAGIGTAGGSGGSGGDGGAGATVNGDRGGGSASYINTGLNGSAGGSSQAAGNVYAIGTTLSLTNGSNGSGGGTSPAGYWNYYDRGSGWDSDYSMSAGGSGGGGGSGSGGYAIGSGGYGGGGGGGGAAGFVNKGSGYNYYYYRGLGGGAGYGAVTGTKGNDAGWGLSNFGGSSDRTDHWGTTNGGNGGSKGTAAGNKEYTTSSNHSAIYYTVKLNKDGATGAAIKAPDFFQMKLGDAMPATVNAAYLRGYQFMGYYTAATGGTQYYKGTTGIISDSTKSTLTTAGSIWEPKDVSVIKGSPNPTLYAHFEPLADVNILLNGAPVTEIKKIATGAVNDALYLIPALPASGNTAINTESFGTEIAKAIELNRNTNIENTKTNDGEYMAKVLMESGKNYYLYYRTAENAYELLDTGASVTAYTKESMSTPVTLMYAGVSYKLKYLNTNPMPSVVRLNNEGTSAVEALKLTLEPVSGFVLPETVEVRSLGNVLEETDYTYSTETGDIEIPAEKITGLTVLNASGEEETVTFYLNTVGGRIFEAGWSKLMSGDGYTYAKKVGTVVSLPTPTSPANSKTVQFAGWYTQPGGKGSKVNSLSSDDLTTIGTDTLYAFWTYKATNETSKSMYYQYYTDYVDPRGVSGKSYIKTSYDHRGYEHRYSFGDLPAPNDKVDYNGDTFKFPVTTGKDIFNDITPGGSTEYSASWTSSDSTTATKTDKKNYGGTTTITGASGSTQTTVDGTIETSTISLNFNQIYNGKNVPSGVTSTDRSNLQSYIKSKAGLTVTDAQKKSTDCTATLITVKHTYISGTKKKTDTSYELTVNAVEKGISGMAEGVDIHVAQVLATEGSYLTINYIIQNRGTAALNMPLNIGAASDVMIGSNDKATMTRVENADCTYLEMKEGSGRSANTFRLYVKGSKYGVTDVDRYWIGGYYESDNKNAKKYWYNTFNDSSANNNAYDTKFTTGRDSALAYSWTINDLAPGATIVKTVKLGVGAADALAKVDLSLRAEGGYFTPGNLEELNVTGDKININGANITVENEDATAGTTSTTYTVNRDGYVFDHWEDINGNTVSGDVAMNTAIVAIWKEQPVTWDLVNASEVYKNNENTFTNENIPPGPTITMTASSDSGTPVNLTKTSDAALVATGVLKNDKTVVIEMEVPEGYLLRNTAEVQVNKGGNGEIRTLSPDTGYTYFTWNNRQNATLMIYGDEVNGTVTIRAGAHPAPAETPDSITVMGQSITYGGIATLTADISPEAGTGKMVDHTYSYQWYESKDGTNQGGTPIDGATGATLTREGLTVGNHQYYCVVTVTRSNGETATVYSEPANVSVGKLTGTVTKPTINGWRYVLDEPNEPSATANSLGTISYIYYTDMFCTRMTDNSLDGGGAAVRGSKPEYPGTYFVVAYYEGDETHTSAMSEATEFKIYYTANVPLPGSEEPIDEDTDSISVPSIPDKFYTGSPMQANVTDTDVYMVTHSAVGTDVGTYTVELVLKSDSYRWADPTTGASFVLNADKTVATATWHIVQAENAWTSELSTGNATYPEAPFTGATAKFGTVVYTYYTNEACTAMTGSANGAGSSGAKPTKAGSYWVKASVTGNDNYTGLETNAGKAFSIYAGSKSAPTSVGSQATTIKGKADGKLTGVNTQMEYTAVSDPTSETAGTAVTGTTVDNLPAGTYYVRYKAVSGETEPSEWVKVVITDGRELTVSFNLNGHGTGTPASQNTVYNGTVAAVTAPTAEHYTFNGWYENAAGTGSAWDFENSKAQSDKTLFAMWTPESYTVSFAAGEGGSGTMTDQSFTYGVSQKLSNNQFTKAGYRFGGWQDESRAAYADGAYISITADMALTAQWIAENGAVIYDLSGGSKTGSAPTTYTVSEETSTTSITIPSGSISRTGYEPTGEYEIYVGDAKLGAEPGETTSMSAVVSGDTITINGIEDAEQPIKVVPGWTPVTYTIAFAAENASGSTASVSAIYDAETTLTANGFTRPGYSFTGWNSNAEGTGFTYNDQSTVKNLTVEKNATVTLYAQWAENYYNITLTPGIGYEFDRADGEITVSGEFRFKVTAKPGYTFMTVSAPNGMLTGPDEEGYYTVKLDPANPQNVTVNVSGVRDNVAPTGLLVVNGLGSWTSPAELQSSGAEYTRRNADLSFTVSGYDATGSGIKYVGYYVSETPVADEALAGLNWTTEAAVSTGNTITAAAKDGKGAIVYAVICDNDGNIIYLNSTGVHFDTTRPVLTAKTHPTPGTDEVAEDVANNTSVLGSVDVTVSDKELDKITVTNGTGEPVTVWENGTPVPGCGYTVTMVDDSVKVTVNQIGPAKEAYVVTGTDKSGNSSSFRFGVSYILVTIPTVADGTYDGTIQHGLVSEDEYPGHSTYYTVSNAEGSPVDAGTYAGEVILTLSDTAHYAWNEELLKSGVTVNAETGVATVSFRINKGYNYFQSEPTLASSTITYGEQPVVNGAARFGTVKFEYRAGTSGEWTEYNAQLLTAGTYQIRGFVAGNANYDRIEGGTLNLTVSKADTAAPGGFTSTDETINGKHDGTITGVKPTMEYAGPSSEAPTGDGPFTQGTGTTINNLEPGSYWVRIPGDDNHNPSAWVKVTVGTGSQLLQINFISESITVKTDSISYGAAATAPEQNPAKTGYDFNDWYSDEARTLLWNPSTTYTAVANIYAKFLPKHFTVTFDPGAGTVSQTTMSAVYDSTYGSLPTPERSGYTFNDWYNGATPVSATDTVTITADVTLTAHWTSNTTTIDFNLNGGYFEEEPGSMPIGQPVTLPTPKKEGYTFDKWYTDEDMENPADAPYTVPSGTPNLYAGWTVNTHAVTWDFAGGVTADAEGSFTSGDAIAYGTPITAPTVTRTGYTFTGWNADVPQTMPDRSLSFTANWTINKYTVTLPSGTGYTITPTGGSNSPADYGTTYTFTVPLTGGYGIVPTVTVIIDGTPTTLIPDETGVYSFPVTGNSTIVIGDITNVTAADATITVGGYTGMSWSSVSANTEPVLTAHQYKDAQNIKIAATASVGTVSQVYYLVTNTAIASFATDAAWTLETGGFANINTIYTPAAGTSDKVIVYVCVVNNDGLPAYYRTDYVMFDAKAPEITNPETKKVVITDDNLARVLINGDEQEFTGNSFTKNLTPSDGDYIFQAYDQAGNMSEFTYGVAFQRVTVPAIENKVYNGTMQSATVAQSSLYTVVSNIAHTDAGEYTVTLRLNDPVNYAWQQNGEVSGISGSDAVLVWQITRGTNAWSTPLYAEPSYVYSGASKNATAAALYGVPAFTYYSEYVDDENCTKTSVALDGALFAGGAPVNTGTYYVKVDVPDCDSYTGLTTTAISFSIVKATYEAVNTNLFTVGHETIDGKDDGSIKLTGSVPAGRTIEFSTDGGITWVSFTNRDDLPDGTYKVRYAGDDNYNPSEPVDIVINAGGKLTMSFVSNGGSTVESITNLSYGAAPSAPEAPDKTGYGFIGWYRNAGLSEAWDFASDKVYADTILYAKWSTNSYTVSFDGNDSDGGATAAEVFAYGETKALTANGFTRTNYTFNSWNTNTDGTGTIYVDGQDITVTSSITLYAQWTQNTTGINFDTGGGTFTDPLDQPQPTYNEGEQYPLPTPTRPGYDFGGWAEYPGTDPVDQPYTIPSGGVPTLTAIWTVKSFTLSFNTLGGTTVASITQDYATAVTAPEPPVKAGYEFGGWNPEMPATMPAENKTLTAVWNLTSYAISYNLGGGTNHAQNPLTYTTEDQTTLKAASRTGYTFDGWYTSGGEQVTSLYGMYGDLDLTARWTAKEFVISLNPGEGGNGGPTTIPAIYGQPLPDIPEEQLPTKTGYTFLGYGDDSEPAKTYIGSTGAGIIPWDVDGTKTLHALWAVNTYNLSFYSNGVLVASDAAVYGSSVTLSSICTTTPSAAGQVFVAWLSGGVLYNSGDCITVPGADMVFNAQFASVNTATVSALITDIDGRPISGAKVTITEGNTPLTDKKTDDNGMAAFNGITFGRYILSAVYTYAGKDITRTVDIDVDQPEFGIGVSMASIRLNTVVKCEDDTRMTVSNGLMDEITAQEREDVTEGQITAITVTMTAKESAQTGVNNVIANTLVSGAAIDYETFIDIQVSKTTTTKFSGKEIDSVEPIYETNDVLRLSIEIPADLKAVLSQVGINKLVVTRYHDGTVTTLDRVEPPTGTEEAIEGTFWINTVGAKQYVVIGASKFSVYALGVPTDSEPPRSDDPIVPPAPIPPEDPVHHKKPVVPTEPAIELPTIIGPASPAETGVDRFLICDEHIAFLNGYEDGTVRPEANMTRAEVAQMFYNLLKDKNRILGRTNFFDISSGDWFYKAVVTLTDMGIIKGIYWDQFQPNDPITRAEFTAIAMRFAYSVEGERNFSDVAPSFWAHDLIGSAATYGWINGYDDGTFIPGGYITRAEVTVMVNNILGRSADVEYINQHSGQLHQYSDLRDPGKWYYYEIIEATNGHDHEYDENLNELWTAIDASAPEGTTSGTESGSNYFVDTEGHWSEEAAEFMGERGLFIGIGGRIFDPNVNMTRSMLAQLLYRLEGSPAVYGNNPFEDIDSSKWYSDAIVWAANMGIVQGYNGTMFAPEDKITREHMALMLYRYADRCGYTLEGNRRMVFIDDWRVHDYTRNAVDWMVAKGIYSGVAKGWLDPLEPLTRGQAATMLQRFIISAEI